MLVQPLRNLAPRELLEPEIPGRTEPLLPSGEWGINLAAAQGNFPKTGLQVYIPAWSAMGIVDTVELLLNSNVVDQHTITEDTEVGQRTTLWVAPRHWRTGSYTLAYRVTRRNQAPETFTPSFKLYAKLELPGGQDTNPEFGHSELYQFIDPAIINDGVDQNTAKDGVDIIIQAKPGSPTQAPYPNIAVGDVITSSWGGVFVSSEPVTQVQIDDPDNYPIIIHVTEAIILEAGDSGPDGLAVTFMITDLVKNVSEDWCEETRIVVDTGNARLGAPIIEQANGNELDLDTLGDEDPVAQVWADSEDEFHFEDFIIMHVKGTTLDGEVVDIEVRKLIDKQIPARIPVSLPNAAARSLAKTQAVFFYDLERNGTIIQRSKGRFINIIGEPKRLAAPSAEDEQQGAIDPDLTSTRIRIPFDEIMAVGMAIELKWFGTRSDTSTYDPELDWYFPSHDEIEAKEDFFITVEGKHLKTLEGGTLDLSYNLLSDEGGTIVSRGSLHAALLTVGEAQFELVKPIVLGEQDGALDPEDLPNGVGRLTAPNPTASPTKAKDVVTYTWDGEVTGKKEDSTTINALSAGKDVNFTLNAAFVAEHIEPNRGKKVTASYRILRFETGKTSYSNPLEFVVGEAQEFKLPVATFKEATGQQNDQLNPDDVYPDGATVVIAATAQLKTDDEVTVTVEGKTTTPYPHTVLSTEAGTELSSIKVPHAVINENDGQSISLSYTVKRKAGGTDGPSVPTVYDVRKVIGSVGENFDALPNQTINKPGQIIETPTMTISFLKGGTTVMAISETNDPQPGMIDGKYFTCQTTSGTGTARFRLDLKTPCSTVSFWHWRVQASAPFPVAHFYGPTGNELNSFVLSSSKDTPRLEKFTAPGATRIEIEHEGSAFYDRFIFEV